MSFTTTTTNLKGIKFNNSDVNILKFNDTVAWAKSYTLTLSKDDGVKSLTADRTSTLWAAKPIGTVSNGSSIYHGDNVKTTAAAYDGYKLIEDASRTFTITGDTKVDYTTKVYGVSSKTKSGSATKVSSKLVGNNWQVTYKDTIAGCIVAEGPLAPNISSDHSGGCSYTYTSNPSVLTIKIVRTIIGSNSTIPGTEGYTVDYYQHYLLTTFSAKYYDMDRIELTINNVDDIAVNVSASTSYRDSSYGDYIGMKGGNMSVGAHSTAVLEITGLSTYKQQTVFLEVEAEAEGYGSTTDHFTLNSEGSGGTEETTTTVEQ